jgi:H+/Cl- antiporter ClcA
LRFSIASLFFICLGFIFLCLWGFFSFLLDSIYNALSPTAVDDSILLMQDISWAFGVICALFFIVGIVLIFVLDSFADEPEMYWRQ